VLIRLGHQAGISMEEKLFFRDLILLYDQIEVKSVSEILF
jgi:hypothetical protein